MKIDIEHEHNKFEADVDCHDLERYLGENYCDPLTRIAWITRWRRAKLCQLQGQTITEEVIELLDILLSFIPLDERQLMTDTQAMCHDLRTSKGKPPKPTPISSITAIARLNARESTFTPALIALFDDESLPETSGNLKKRLDFS